MLFRYQSAYKLLSTTTGTISPFATYQSGHSYLLNRIRAMTSSSVSSDIALDEFAFRQFDISSSYAGTKIPVSRDAFMQRVHNFYNERKAIADEFPDRPVLVDGYAPFCKHIFMPNFNDEIVDPAVLITADNEHLLRTKYDARTENELPVLTRYFPAGSVKPSPSKFLDLILYSKEQIEKERAATGRDTTQPLEDAPWRLISIKAQGVPYEIPMNPITIMRNELISQGGSGVPIDKEAYMKSVEYWKEHAIII